jgi:hypothetical protein
MEKIYILDLAGIQEKNSEIRIDTVVYPPMAAPKATRVDPYEDSAAHTEAPQLNSPSAPVK